MKEIFERRSIRKYTDAPVSDTDIEKLLRAGMQAPSAVNQQPWEFAVLKDKDLMLKVLEFHPYSTPLKTAACAIVVCMKQPLNAMLEPYRMQDCAAATQNILLEATHLGLGTVWMGVYPDETRVNGVRELIQAPAEITPFCIIAVGHPAEQPAPADRYDESRVHINQW
ncbi:MAG: nitroreductase family protein [Peptococcaceae bacterium]|nr:nitroreductase family protein [Peptococcaceae bacterium]